MDAALLLLPPPRVADSLRRRLRAAQLRSILLSRLVADFDEKGPTVSLVYFPVFPPSLAGETAAGQLREKIKAPAAAPETASADVLAPVVPLLFVFLLL